jgi:DNA-binding MarR family transcriptional regulator
MSDRLGPPPASPEWEAEAGPILLMGLFTTIRQMRAHAGEPIDLASMYLLYNVLQKPGIRVSELAGDVGLDASTMSRHVQNLTRAGYLKRSTALDDKRAAAVHLTDQGLEVILKIVKSRSAMIIRAMENWNAEDRQRFLELALRFVVDFSESTQPGVSAGIKSL